MYQEESDGISPNCALDMVVVHIIHDVFFVLDFDDEVWATLHDYNCVYHSCLAHVPINLAIETVAPCAS